MVRISVPKLATEVPVSASLLIDGQSLVLQHADIGIDLDKNTYYDVQLPKHFQSDRAFVIKMNLGSPKTKSERLMDAKM